MANQRWEMGAMSVYQNSQVRIELFSSVKGFVYSRNFNNHLVREWTIYFKGLKYGPIYTNPVKLSIYFFTLVCVEGVLKPDSWQGWQQDAFSESGFTGFLWPNDRFV